MNAGGTRTTAVRRQGDWYSPWIDRQKYKPTEEGRTTDMDQPPGNKLKGAHSSADHKIRAKGVTRLIPSAIPNVRRRGMVRGNLASLASYWSFVYLPFYQCKAFAGQQPKYYNYIHCEQKGRLKSNKFGMTPMFSFDTIVWCLHSRSAVDYNIIVHRGYRSVNTVICRNRSAFFVWRGAYLLPECMQQQPRVGYRRMVSVS